MLVSTTPDLPLYECTSFSSEKDVTSANGELDMKLKLEHICARVSSNTRFINDLKYWWPELNESLTWFTYIQGKIVYKVVINTYKHIFKFTLNKERKKIES